MINSRSLEFLQPCFKHAVLGWMEKCGAAGLDVLVVSTFRDDEFQTKLYNQGRTTAGRIVTYARAGQSKHNHGLALDYCIMEGKRCDWDDVQGFTKAGIIAEECGLDWAGRWNGRMKELGHIESQKSIITLINEQKFKG